MGDKRVDDPPTEEPTAADDQYCSAIQRLRKGAYRPRWKAGTASAWPLTKLPTV
jgi:hypothetical protein